MPASRSPVYRVWRRLVANGSGGPNDFTERARAALAAAQRAMHDCLIRYGCQRT
ncbi:MAG TPA: hypothetical protein VNH11_12205 [Pirellulales bacterium]|nr:hypothetical protein [Pirellulales bacterium]